MSSCRCGHADWRHNDKTGPCLFGTVPDGTPAVPRNVVMCGCSRFRRPRKAFEATGPQSTLGRFA